MPGPVSASPDLLPILSRGKHRNSRKGACFMEMASVLAGEKWSDHPRCTHPLLADLARHVNDATSDDNRHQLARADPGGRRAHQRRPAGRRPDRPALRHHRPAGRVRGAAERRSPSRCSPPTASSPASTADRWATSSRPVARALESAPRAAEWARDVRPPGRRHGQGLPPARRARHACGCAVHGIAEACVPDPDAILRQLLRRRHRGLTALCEPEAATRSRRAPTSHRAAHRRGLTRCAGSCTSTSTSSSPPSRSCAGLSCAGCPVVVGGDGDPTKRGVVSTASYEARALGVHSGRPAAHRRRGACPDAVFLPVDKEAYDAASAEVMAALRSFGTPCRGARLGRGVPRRRRPTTRRRWPARSRTGCATRPRWSAASASGRTRCRPSWPPASASRPGVFRLTYDTWFDVLGDQPTDALWGIGRKLSKRLAAVGITTVKELAAADPESLKAPFGPSTGPWLVSLAQRPRTAGRSPARRTSRAARAGRSPSRRDLDDWDEVRREVVRAGPAGRRRRRRPSTGRPHGSWSRCGSRRSSPAPTARSWSSRAPTRPSWREPRSPRWSGSPTAGRSGCSASAPSWRENRRMPSSRSAARRSPARPRVRAAVVPIGRTNRGTTGCSIRALLGSRPCRGAQAGRTVTSTPTLLIRCSGLPSASDQ